MNEYNDLLLEYRTTKQFKEEADLLGLSQSGRILAEREQALLEALRKLNKNFVR